MVKFPKILDPISGQPFLEYLIKWLNLSMPNINFNILLATGYLHEKVATYVDSRHLKYILVREDRPLGTLGAINNVVQKISSTDCLIINGDTIFDCKLDQAYSLFKKTSSHPLLVVKRSVSNDRFGGYHICPDSNYLFRSPCEASVPVISMGACFATADSIKTAFSRASKCLVERPMIDADFLSSVQTRYFLLDESARFIDIGVPSSFLEAQTLLSSWIKL